MSDHPGLPAAGQMHAGRLAVGVDVIAWGSSAAQEAVNRVCREVTSRCEQVIAAQAADTPDEHTAAETSGTAGPETAVSETAGNSPEADEYQP